MDSASSDDVLHPRGHKVPRRRYVAQKTSKVKFLPPAQAMRLMSGTRVRSCKFVTKPKMLQNGKACQKSIKTSKPLGICSKGSGSCLPNSNLNPSLNDHIVSAESDQKSRFGKGKQKGKEVASAQKTGLGVGKRKGKKIALTQKRKLAHKDGPNNAKLAYTAAVGCSS